MTRFLLVCFGGAAGSGLRYLVSLWAGRRLPAGFPYGTLLVNVAGCLLMSFLMHLALTLTSFPLNLRLALTTGFLGGLTTYSTFNFETAKLLEDGAIATAAGYAAATIAGCFAAGILGHLIARGLVDT